MRPALLLPLFLAGCLPAMNEPFQLIGDVNDLDTYGDRTCLLDGAGEVSCLGAALLGDDPSGVPVPIGAPAPASHVAVGLVHACVAHPGGVSCWGFNDDNVLGVGIGDCPPASSPDVPPPTCYLSSRVVDGLGEVHELDAGDRFTCAIGDVDDVVMCWGATAGGRLGRVAVGGVAAPAQVVTVDGDALVAQHVSVADGRGCAIDLAGALWCWGDEWGAAGARLIDDGPFAELAVGADHLCTIDVGGKVSCRGENLNGESGDRDAARACTDRPCRIEPHTVIGPEGATGIAVGARHSCANDRATGALWCWGSNELGQLGRSDAFLVGAPGRVDEVREVVDVRAGDAHTCAITDEGLAWCWGLDAGTCAGDCR